MNFYFIFHGFGWLVLLFLGLCFLGAEAILKSGNVTPGAVRDLATAIAYICAAIPCWFVGRYLLKYKKDKVNDNGEKVHVSQPYHALFFVPMHWWSPIFIVIGGCLLIYGSQRNEALKTQPITPVEPKSSSSSAHQTLKGSQLSYSVEIPKGWEFRRNHENFDIFTTAMESNGNYWLGVFVQEGAKGDTERWVSLILGDPQATFGGSFKRSGSVVIDAQEWTVLDGSIQDSNTRLICRMYAYAGTGTAYTIMTVGTNEEWSKQQDTFDSIVQSFKFPNKIKK